MQIYMHHAMQPPGEPPGVSALLAYSDTRAAILSCQLVRYKLFARDSPTASYGGRGYLPSCSLGLRMSLQHLILAPGLRISPQARTSDSGPGSKDVTSGQNI